MTAYREQENKIRIHRWHWSGCCTAVAVLWFVTGLPASAQWSLTQFNVPVTEDFSSFTAPSTWGTPDPNADQLDSDIWTTHTSSATGSSFFGFNNILGEGINTGGATTVGMYAFDAGAGVKGIGPQADDSLWTTGNLTIKLQNDTGSEIEELRVEWSYLSYNDQSGRRASQLAVSNTDSNGSYTAPFGGELLTQDAPQAPLFWIITPRDLTFNVSIPDGDDYYLRWTFTDLAGSEGSGVNRDEVGIADLRVTPVAPIFGDFDSNGIVDGSDFLDWQRDPNVGLLSDWENNYGMVGPISTTTAAAPEPTTYALALAALCLAMGRRRCY